MLWLLLAVKLEITSMAQQTLVKMSVIMILVVINNVIRCGHYSRVATIKGVAFNHVNMVGIIYKTA